MRVGQTSPLGRHDCCTSRVWRCVVRLLVALDDDNLNAMYLRDLLLLDRRNDVVRTAA